MLRLTSLIYSYLGSNKILLVFECQILWEDVNKLCIRSFIFPDDYIRFLYKIDFSVDLNVGPRFYNIYSVLLLFSFVFLLSLLWY